MDATPRQSKAETDYADLLRESLAKPFSWGTHDCVTFAAAAVRARTGRDVLDIELTWHTAFEAATAIEAEGGLHAAVTKRLGDPLPRLRARVGDVALVTDPVNGRGLLGVCHGDVILCPSEAGLAMLPLTAAQCVWRP
jgi:hypothetical protein